VFKLAFALAFSLTACGSSGSHHGPDAPGGGGDGGVDAPVGPVVPGADPTFGEGGLATVGFPGKIAAIMKIARQADGKIVGCGATEEALVVARVTPGGVFDTGFGHNGVVQLPWGVATNGVGIGYGCAIQPDGKIVASARILGSYQGLGSVEVLVRLLPDGSLDPAFAQVGYVVGPKYSSAFSLTLDSNGNMVVGGSGKLERFLPDGTRDTTFGTAGTSTITMNVFDLAMQSDGKIVAIGGKTLARFTTAGAADTTFGTNGTVTVPGTQSYDQLYSVAIQSDGSIVVGGALTTPAGGSSENFWLGRYTTAGAPDSTFGTAGGVTPGSSGGGIAYGVAIDGSGHVVGTGYAMVGSTTGSSARFSSAGVLDSMYGAGGIGVQYPSGSLFSNAVLEPGGAVTAAGSMIDTGSFGYEIAFTRTTPSGVGDTTFGTNGLVKQSVGGSFDRAQAIAVQPDGKVVLGGWAFSGGGAALARLNHDGSVDGTFGTNGVLTDPTGHLQYVNAVAVQADGKILVSGLPSYGAGGKRLFTVERYDSMGKPDLTFGTMGSVTVALITGMDAAGMNMTVAGDGTIVLVGSTATATANVAEFGVVELTVSGVPKSSFGTNGVAMTAFGSGYNVASHAVVQADGSVIVLGLAGTGPKLVRFTAAGVLDSTFGTVTLPGPMLGSSPMGLALQPDGKFIAIGAAYLTGETDIVRYTAAGALDTSFATAGVLHAQLAPNDYYGMYSFYGITVLPSGQLMIGFAGSSADGLTEHGVLMRLNADGTADASYGPGGMATLQIGRGSTSVNAMTLDADGKLLIVGRTWTETGSSDFMAMRFVL
jgi:uncharacterized delta-60 repeat protein